MVRLTIQAVCLKRGLTKPHHLFKLLQARGYKTNESQAGFLFNEKGDGMKLETLEMLCAVLDCKVSDLITREKEM